MSDDSAVRLYHVSDDGIATTLLYGTLAEALARAATEPDAVADGLYLQTRDDVVAYRDLAAG